MLLQTVKFIVKKSKYAGLAQEIGFSGPNSCSLPWLVKVQQMLKCCPFYLVFKVEITNFDQFKT
jgi:hypothetical protein